MESSEYEESDRMKLMRIRERVAAIRLSYRNWAVILSLGCIILSLAPERRNWIQVGTCAFVSISLWWAHLNFNTKPRLWSQIATVGLGVLWLVSLANFSLRVTGGEVDVFSFEGYTNVLLTIGVLTSAMSVIRSSELKLIEENREAWETYGSGHSLTYKPARNAQGDEAA